MAYPVGWKTIFVGGAAYNFTQHMPGQNGCTVFMRLSIPAVFSSCALAVIIAAGGVSDSYADDASRPVAMIDDEVITLTEIENSLSGTLAALNEQIYRLRRQRIDELITERLLIKEANGAV